VAHGHLATNARPETSVARWRLQRSDSSTIRRSGRFPRMEAALSATQRSVTRVGRIRLHSLTHTVRHKGTMAEEYDVFIQLPLGLARSGVDPQCALPSAEGGGPSPSPLDVEDFVPGGDLVLEMARAGQSSRAALCVVSPDYFSGNRMVGFEALNSRRSDPSGSDSRLIPFLLRRTELPEWIRGLVPMDWTDPRAHAREWKKLLKVLGAPFPDAVPPPGVDQPIGFETLPSGPNRSDNGDLRTASRRPRMIFMKVDPRVAIPQEVCS
jgi:hypothetical protein